MSSFLVTCPLGTEEALAQELNRLGVSGQSVSRGVWRLEGALADAYRVALWSRVASRVLCELGRFEAPDAEALYAQIRELSWEDHLSRQTTFLVECVAARSRKQDHTRFLAQRTKDGVVDRLRARLGGRPDVDRDDPDLRILIHWADEVTVSVDLRGPLHARRYRMRGHAAPLRENLAAACLELAQWTSESPLIDPMCGSGTFLIEAAWMAKRVAPGLLRPSLRGWLGHQHDAWAELVADAREQQHAAAEQEVRIQGSDSDRRSVVAAREAIARAGISGVTVEHRDVRDLAPPAGWARGHLVVNPPYGERLGEQSEAEVLHAQLGDALKSRFGGWTAHVLTPKALMGALGLRPERRHTVYNGPLECRWASYPIVASKPASSSSRRWRTDADPFANRLRKNLRTVGAWARRNEVHCHRLYDADIPEFPVAVDRYDGHVVVSEYARSSKRKGAVRLRDLMPVIAYVLDVPEREIHLRVRAKQGAGQYQKRGESAAERVVVHEGDHAFLVNLKDYVDVGLFPDHRVLRAKIAQEAQGKRFLNLFAYTCTASVGAAANRAQTTNVDLSATYLEWGKDNFTQNRLRARDHEFVQTDALQFLNRSKRRWDVVFLNPPSFSRSKSMRGDFVLVRDQTELIERAMDRVAADGTLYFSTHARDFELDPAILQRFAVRDITAKTVPRDFARHPFRAWTLRARSRS